MADDIKSTARNMYHKSGAGHIIKLFVKWFLILALGFVLLKWLIGKVMDIFKGPSTGTGHVSWWTWLTGNYAVDPNAAGGNYQPPNSGATSTLASIRALVDQIENLLGGYTFLYYPDVVNRLANLSTTDLKKAAYYWDQKYKTGHGSGLYKFIYAEDWSGYYKPALGALKKANITW